MGGGEERRGEERKETVRREEGETCLPTSAREEKSKRGRDNLGGERSTSPALSLLPPT